MLYYTHGPPLGLRQEKAAENGPGPPPHPGADDQLRPSGKKRKNQAVRGEKKLGQIKIISQRPSAHVTTHMGKISILTPRQKKVLSFVKESKYLTDRFYFTGGTALSEYYLQHRYSEDIDLFSEQPVNAEKLQEIVSDWAKRLGGKVNPQFIDNRMYICLFEFARGQTLKVDLCYYPYPRIDKSTTIDGLAVDSLLDIATNKMTTISQRGSEKDFVDLYYLYPKFGYWDLSYAVEKKFRIKLDKFIISSDMTVVENFTTLPRMIKPLTLPQLKTFFRDTAIDLSQDAVEK